MPRIRLFVSALPVDMLWFAAVAMQTAGGITYLHADHLGSTSVTSGAVSSTQVYYP